MMFKNLSPLLYEQRKMPPSFYWLCSFPEVKLVPNCTYFLVYCRCICMQISWKLHMRTFRQETTSEVTDDQEKMNNFFQQNKLVKFHWLAMHRPRLFCAQWSLWWKCIAHYFYSCARHRHALASKALPEYLKIVYQGTGSCFQSAL